MRAQEAWALMTAGISEEQVLHMINRIDQSIMPDMCTGKLMGSMFALMALRAKHMVLHGTPETMMAVIASSKAVRSFLDPVADVAELAFLNFHFSAAASPLAQMDDDRQMLREAIDAIESAITSGALPQAVHIPANCCATTLRLNIADLDDDIADFKSVLEYGRRGFYALQFDFDDPHECFAYFLLCNSLGAALIKVGADRKSAELFMEAVTVFSAYLVRAKRVGSVQDEFFALMGLGKAHLNLATEAGVDEPGNLGKAKAVLDDARRIGTQHPDYVGDGIADTVLALVQCQKRLDSYRARVIH